MEYFHKQETPNHRLIQIKNFNHFKNNSYKHSSTDNIFQNKKGDTLHKLYNKFLVNPYLIRNSRYQIALNNNNINFRNFTQDDNNQKNNYNNNINQTNEKEIYEEKKEIIQNKPKEINNNNLEQEKNHNINFPNINNYQRENLRKSPKNIRKQILNEENKNLYPEDNPINKYDNMKFPKINDNNFKFNYKTIERPIEYNVIYKNNNNDMYFSNNRNKLSLSYDIKNRKDLKNIDENLYISPIIAKIVKHNYLMKNPYSDKDESLGPSYLKNNPILYPISTYKFDFNRYINNYHVKKYV